jgi:hypothetical protein
VVTRSRIRRSTKHSLRWFRRLALAAFFVGALAPAQAPGESGIRFVVTLPPGSHAGPLTGRVFVALSRHASPEPREEAGDLATSVPFFGKDVAALDAGRSVTIDAATPGYPTPTLRDVPAGTYCVQAILSVYTRFVRADGHTIWAHADRWEGQQFGLSPGNLVSPVQCLPVDPAGGQTIALSLTRTLPPVVVPPDTPWVKHVKIKSALLSKFWGAPIFLGAIVLLPKDYDASNRAYATVYQQGHFSLHAPLGFDELAKPATAAQTARAKNLNRETSDVFSREWMTGSIPPLVAVTFQHPTPYYDDSYAVDSPNNGPYGTAIMTELIPYLEAHYRLIADGRHRFLIGGSTGGWEALALQIDHPGDFNGAWGLYPDPVDFNRFQMGNLSTDVNAFTQPYAEWNTPEIPAQRLADGLPVETMRGESRLEYVRGSHGRSGEQFNAWDAAWGPLGADGYPREFWDKHTGVIDRAAVTWSREHGYDLTAFLQANYAALAPKLDGKLHIDVGDDDDYFLNLACYRMQAYLDSATPSIHAVFSYGRPLKPHGYQAKATADYLREMAERARQE